MLCLFMKYIVSNTYTFAVDVHEQEWIGHTYRFVSMSKHPQPCVQITVDDDMGIIDTLSDELHEKWAESIYMLKTALTFVNEKHPSIISYDLEDLTFLHLPNKPLVTARRLILGDKGWYEEHLNAVPSKKTSRILQVLRNPRRREVFRDKIPLVDDTWWSPMNTMALCYVIRIPWSVLSTSWYISQKVIQGYNISYEEKENTNGLDSDKMRRIFKEAFDRKIPYDEILDAKYRNPIIEKGPWW